jgi:hypothetical protein
MLRSTWLVLALTSNLAACADVAPYQRGRLAHPTMTPNDGSSIGRAHVQSVQEGASGGGNQVSGGCGCN